MKRLISLSLFLSSLSLCSAAAQAQTWQIDYSGTNPCIDVRNDGRVRVVWLDGTAIRTSYWTGSNWSSPVTFHVESSNPSICNFLYNSYDNSSWYVWDSLDYYLIECYQDGGWHHFMLDSIGINWHPKPVSNIMGEGDSGKVFFAWEQYTKSGRWNTLDTAQLVLSGDGFMGDGWSIIDISHSSGFLRPELASVFDWIGVEISSHTGLYRTYYDTIWASSGITSYGSSLAVPYGHDWENLGISYADTNKVVTTYYSKVYTDSGDICSSRFTPGVYENDTTYVIAHNVHVQSGAISRRGKPVLAWSDDHSIFLNAYYDTIWSHPPVQISDPGLLNCINPDIVAENDSTVWVCYQNDGEIYVTRTSVPLGVTGNPNIAHRISKSISLKAWPNPALNLIHFSYTLPAKQNSSVSIYDIAGRLVKTLEISENQTNWNCANDAGRKVASGVYFARLKSDGQETIQRISIIK